MVSLALLSCFTVFCRGLRISRGTQEQNINNFSDPFLVHRVGYRDENI
jgi:hypothetical protein